MTTIRNIILGLICFVLLVGLKNVLVDSIYNDDLTKTQNVLVTHVGKNHEEGVVSNIVITNKGMFFISDTSKVLLKKLVPDKTYTFFTKHKTTGFNTKKRILYSAYEE